MDPMGKNVPNMVKQLFLLGKASSLDGKAGRKLQKGHGSNKTTSNPNRKEWGD